MSQKRPRSSRQKPSPFAAYSPELFVQSASWPRLELILREKRGGNYGIAGPRGAGKSWLMLQAAQVATESKGLAVWFPSPSEYNPLAFLASLSEVTAQRYIENYLGSEGYATETYMRRLLTRRRMLAITTGALSIVLVLISSVRTSGVRLFPQSSYFWLRMLTDPFFIGSIIMLFLYIFFAVRLVWRPRPRRKSEKETLYDRAIEIRRQARFTSAHKEAGDRSIGGSIQGLTAAFKQSTELSLAERPSTISSLIHDYRDFVGKVAALLDGPVVVSIDELDKIQKPGAVTELLRDIKGVFDVRGVHYFVSISDEAATSVTLGALKKRNEYNSSFYQVFKASPLTRDKCQVLLARRGIRIAGQDLTDITVLSGGLPRELVRLADMLLDGERNSGSSAGAMIVRDELLALQESIERLADTGALQEQDELRAQEMIESLTRMDGVSNALLPEFWSPGGVSDAWISNLQGQWRRVLLRHNVAQVLDGEVGQDGHTSELQEMVRRSEVSPTAGRRLMTHFSDA